METAEQSGSSTTVTDDGSDVPTVKEGKCTIHLKQELNTFYNPAQEINRDISVLGIHTNVTITPLGKKKGKPEQVTVLGNIFKEGPAVREVRRGIVTDCIIVTEAMAASGIRSIRYAKEIPGLSKVIANDISPTSVELIKQNCWLNDVTSLVEPHLGDACAFMHNEPNRHFVVDIDPYGTPIPFLDAAINCVSNGGLLLVTATDLAILAGNAAETCFAKYGSMSLKSDACHEMALRIVIHAVQSIANKYARYVIPLLSLKIDFYVRLFFRVFKGAEICKESVSKTSMVLQCVSCHSLSFQPLGMRKPDGKYGFATAIPKCDLCSHCLSKLHVGGPMWTGPIHDRQFVSAMLSNLKEDYAYLGTRDRIEGMLHLVMEEVETPLYYNPNKLCSFLKAPTIPLLKLRSALMTLGYEVSTSHTGPNTLKTSAPNLILWDIIRTWAFECNPALDSDVQEAARILLSKPKESWTQGIDFKIRPDANPASREAKIMRYQQNLGFGPGVRSTFKLQLSKTATQQNQGKRRKRKHQE